MFIVCVRMKWLNNLSTKIANAFRANLVAEKKKAYLNMWIETYCIYEYIQYNSAIIERVMKMQSLLLLTLYGAKKIIIVVIQSTNRLVLAGRSKSFF